MHLFRAKTFFCRPNSQTQTFRYRSIKQNKRFCYRLSKQNKTTLRTIFFFWNQQILPLVTLLFQAWNHECQALGTRSSLQWKPLSFENINSNFWEPAIPCNGNLWFPGWEPGVPTSGNRQFLAMVTCGSHVGNSEFQPLGTGSSLPWTKRKHSATGPLSKTKRSLPVH